MIAYPCLAAWTNGDQGQGCLSLFHRGSRRGGRWLVARVPRHGRAVGVPRRAPGHPEGTAETTDQYNNRVVRSSSSVLAIRGECRTYVIRFRLAHRYFLQPRAAKHRPSKISSNSTPPGTLPGLGSLRVKIHYTADHVFPSEMYDRLRTLLLDSVNVQPITSSAVYILGEIVASKMEAAQPLVRVLVHHGQLVSVMRALASHEISKLT